MKSQNCIPFFKPKPYSTWVHSRYLHRNCSSGWFYLPSSFSITFLLIFITFSKFIFHLHIIQLDYFYLEYVSSLHRQYLCPESHQCAASCPQFIQMVTPPTTSPVRSVLSTVYTDSNTIQHSHQCAASCPQPWSCVLCFVQLCKDSCDMNVKFSCISESLCC